MYNDNIPTYQREQMINIRISNRNIPSQELEPLLSFYPKSTKYIQQPILDSRNKPNTKKYEMYSTRQTFNPGSKSPWQGYVNAINIETELKKPKEVYVPASKSDLYNYPTITKNYAIFGEPPQQIKSSKESIFHNYTRSWLNS